MNDDLREFTGNRADDIARQIEAKRISDAIELEASYQVQALAENETLQGDLMSAGVGDLLGVGGVQAEVIRKDNKEIKLKLIDGSYAIYPIK